MPAWSIAGKKGALQGKVIKNMTKLYYQAPSDDIFEEVKKAAIEVWKEKDNTGGYGDEKIAIVEKITNVGDNLMYIVAIFDHLNQVKLAEKLSDKIRQAIRLRMIDGGNSEEYILF